MEAEMKKKVIVGSSIAGGVVAVGAIGWFAKTRKWFSRNPEKKVEKAKAKTAKAKEAYDKAKNEEKEVQKAASNPTVEKADKK